MANVGTGINGPFDSSKFETTRSIWLAREAFSSAVPRNLNSMIRSPSRIALKAAKCSTGWA